MRFTVISKPDVNLALLESGVVVRIPLLHRFSVGAGSVVEIIDGVVSRVIVS